MADQPQPVLAFSMPGLTQADIDKLNTNYDDIHNAIPTDLIGAFNGAGLTLTANAVGRPQCRPGSTR